VAFWIVAPCSASIIGTQPWRCRQHGPPKRW